MDRSDNMPSVVGPSHDTPAEMPRYLMLAEALRAAMQDGRLPAGARLASVREAAKQRQVSLNTVLAAYRHLESRGLIEARPQSGYYVRSQLAAPPLPTTTVPESEAQPADLVVLNQIAAVLAANQRQDHIDLSLACPKGGDFYPGAKLGKLVHELTRRKPELLTDYCLPPGPLLLRQEICRHAHSLGMELDPAQICLTNGCMEALQLALRAVTRPGDTVGLESPTYFNLLPLLDRLGLKTVEIPTHPETGLAVDAVELLLQEKRLQAIVAMPNVHNPLGCCMPLAAKQRLARLVNDYRVPLIEDALYAELQFDMPLAPAVKAFDRDGWVLVCASYTKTLAPGFRIGWIEAGRFSRDVADLKFCSSVAQPALLAEATGLFLQMGGYEQHLRRLRRLYAAQLDRLRGLLAAHFPVGTRATAPQGGFLLWVELPEGCDSALLFRQALQHKISIMPGTLYSPSGRYNRHIRLSGCYPFSERHIKALLQLGELTNKQLG